MCDVIFPLHPRKGDLASRKWSAPVVVHLFSLVTPPHTHTPTLTFPYLPSLLFHPSHIFSPSWAGLLE